MYIYDAVTYLIISLLRLDNTKYLKRISNDLSKRTGKNKISLFFDMISALLKYGAIFNDYYNLNFVNKTPEIRDTYVTYYFNDKLFRKLNPYKYRFYFRDKVEFNKTFSKYIKREWLDLNEANFEEFSKFVEDKEKIIAKITKGHSGIGVKIFRKSDYSSMEDLYKELIEGNFGIVEEVLKNHQTLEKLNESSLNTIRLVSILNQNEIDIIYAGLRIGAKGSDVDNISDGGAVVPIDIESGYLVGSLKTKPIRRKDNVVFNLDVNDIQIPYWNEVKKMVAEASLVIPQVRYLAWDIAVTPNGPAIIEANETSGCAITQIHLRDDEPGLKIKLLKYLDN